MNLFEAVILGIVEGLTEFLPVSSTGHITITEKLLGIPIDDRSVTAFTAVIQFGAIVAVFVYFWKDIVRLLGAWGRGLARKEARSDPDYRFAWLVIIGSIPIGIVGFAAKDLIAGPLRSMWVIAIALVVWCAVIVVAEKVARQDRGEKDVNLRDVLFIGLMQCVALVPGVSRSGSTIMAGLFVGLDRVTATRLSFFLSIPALTAAGAYELPEALRTGGVGWAPTLVGTIVSFIVAYASIAWLLKFVAHNSLSWFVPYRILLGGVLIALLATGVMTAT